MFAMLGAPERGERALCVGPKVPDATPVLTTSLKADIVLPDFAKVKARAERDLLRAVQQQVPLFAPLLKGVATFRQHEGRGSHLTREDNSTSTTEYRRSEFSFTLSREEFKRCDLSAVCQKLVDLARQIAADKTKRMLEVATEAANEVGNVVHADGALTQDKFLDILRKVDMDFDPKTLKLLPGFSFVMHPETAATVVPQMQEWERDPKFTAKHEGIMATKREEWRDREARRKLVG